MGRGLLLIDPENICIDDLEAIIGKSKKNIDLIEVK